MDSTNEDVDPNLRAAVQRAVMEAVGRYRGIGLKAATVSEHAWTWVEDHAEWVQAIIDGDPTGWPKTVRRLVQSDCEALGAAYRSARIGTKPWDNFYYSTAAIETAIKASYHPSGWMDGPIPDTPGLAHYKPTAPHADWVVTRADVSRAMRHLTPEERLILEALYRSDVPHGRLAEALGLSTSGMSDRKESILRKMLRFLGGAEPKRQCQPDCTHPERPLVAA